MTEPYAAFATSWLAIALIGWWAFGEAIALPIIPDVALGILLLSAPHQMPVLSAVAIVGGVAGALVLWFLIRHRPATVKRVIAAQPGLGPPGLEEARDRLAQRGPLAGFAARLGPGLPLKAYTYALAEIAPQTGYGRVCGYALINRLTRLLPPAIVFALAAPLVADVAQSPLLFGAIYAAAWTVFYLVYWWRRDPARRAKARPS